MDIITLFSAGSLFLIGFAIVFSIIVAIAPIVIMIQLRNVNRTLKRIEQQQEEARIEKQNQHQDIIDEFRFIKYKFSNQESKHE